MIKVPQTWAEAKELGLKGLWLYSRVRLLFLVIGVAGTIFVQLLSGFWSFRENHQKLITSQYETTMDADEEFEAARRQYDVIFSGTAPDSLPAYRDVARDYIQSIEALQNLLPSTRPEYEAYVKAIAELQRFYGASEPPTRGTIDGTIFYGEYRVALDRYVIARAAYLGRVASEAGSYVRFIRNS